MTLARSLQLAAVMAGAALAKPLAMPNGGLYATLAVRQEGSTSTVAIASGSDIPSPSIVAEPTVLPSATGGNSTLSTIEAATAAEANASPSATSGNPFLSAMEDWEKVQCDYGSLTSHENNPMDLWDDSQAGAAYAALTAAYASNGTSIHQIVRVAGADILQR